MAGKSSSSAAVAAADDKKKKRRTKDAEKSKEKTRDTKSKSRGDKPASSKRVSSRDKDAKKNGGSKRSRAKSDEVSPAAPAPSPSDAQQATATTTATAAPPSPVVLDPDAVQLFRRYDHTRSGALSRRAFLQLLRDYSGPPLSDTDANGGGVPLGLERSPSNSEFEAGQLFERYDADRTGALSLDGFHRFFADFRSQLAAFARDVGYSTREAASRERAASNLARAKELYARARELAMEEYAAALPRGLPDDVDTGEDSDRHDDSSNNTNSRRSKPIKRAGHTKQQQHQPPEHQLPHASESVGTSRDDLVHALRVKDEMIYELLRERAETRRQRAAAEAYVEELSAVSTVEMRKWARLTDEMQAEIERLRAQLGAGRDLQLQL